MLGSFYTLVRVVCGRGRNPTLRLSTCSAAGEVAWPMRTERSARSISIGVNALASSIVLVCRRRSTEAPAATRREFLTALRSELPQALRLLQTGNVAPVDLAQAAIGPGMAVFTRYAKVLDVAGKPMSVREALALINQIVDEVLAEQEGDFDADSRWALAWFDQHGFAEGDYGVAETLSKAKNTSVSGMVDAGILASQGGKVRLFERNCRTTGIRPLMRGLTAWEGVHHLIRVLDARGETGAAELAGRARRHGRDRARALLPAVHVVRAEETSRPKRCRTTALCRVGRRSLAWRAARRPSRRRCSMVNDPTAAA